MIRIERLQFALYRRNQREWIAGGNTDEETGAAFRRLGKAIVHLYHVEFLGIILSRRFIARSRHNSNYCDRRGRFRF